MNGREFIDTNVLVYADDARDPRKQARSSLSVPSPPAGSRWGILRP